MAARKADDPILAWHYLRGDGRLRYGDYIKVEAGKTYSAKGSLELCECGMHASIKPLDGLRYAPGALVCRVALYGTLVHGDDKLCARHRTVLWMADATETLHRFAIWCAEQALLAERAAGREPQPASWSALAVKARWLDGQASDSELGAAWSAAWSAAESAAESAAWSAAWSAAESAAWSAAESAAWSAAWSAAESAANEKLEAMLLALAPATEDVA